MAGIISYMSAADQGIFTERYQLIPRVLVFIICQRHVLLIKGAPTKRLWTHKYNGVGGHVERGEDIYAAARREVLEETGLQVLNFRFQGMVVIDAGQPTGIGMFIFTAAVPQAGSLPQPIPSAEGNLEWIPFDRVLDLDLVEDLPTLWPKLLTALDQPTSPFFGRYWYDANGQLQIALTDLGVA